MLITVSGDEKLIGYTNENRTTGLDMNVCSVLWVKKYIKEVMKIRIVTTLLLLLIFAGCGVFHPAETVAPPKRMVQQFSSHNEKSDPARIWWQEFQSDELNHLMEQAINDSFSIREAWARLEQARFAAIKAGSDLYPEISGQASGSLTRKKEKDVSVVNSTEWLLGLSASYELDLWGRVRSERESFRLLHQATEEDLKAAMMSVTGQLAENWIRLISVRKQRDLFLEQLVLQKKLLQLVQKRFQLAKSTSLELYQQKQSVEKLDAALISFSAQEETVKRQLALLSGKSSLADFSLMQREFPILGEVPGVGLPAELLLVRPDIAAAAARLKSSRWQVAVARAELLPAIRLTARHNYSADDLSFLFENWLQNLAAGLTGPLLDGNRRKTEVARTQAVVDEKLVAYGKIVFSAIKEVEDALADEQRYDLSLDSLTRQLGLSARTVQEARRRYLNGNSNFLNVLREEANSVQVRQNLIAEQENKLLARIRLYRALGGTWVNGYFH